MTWLRSFEPCHEKKGLQELPIRYGTNWLMKLYKLARVAEVCTKKLNVSYLTI